jgi:glucose-1-phosphate thymidylyltransferase
LLLAGGHGTRLRPLTFSGNKHMLPIANRPILLYGLGHLKDVGIRDVGVILGPIKEGIEEQLGDGQRFGLRISYIAQERPLGIAHAILCAREFLDGGPFMMYLGDNLLEHGAHALANRFSEGDADAVIGVVPVPEPSHYGVAELDDSDRLRSIEEKPSQPRSNLAVVGVYVFGPLVHEVVPTLRPSSRGELEITDLIREIDRRTGRVRVVRLTGWWKDTGRPEDLLEANARVLSSRSRDEFWLRGRIEPGCSVQGLVDMGEGSVLRGGSSIRGPAILGRRVIVENGAYVGPFTALGDDVVLRRAEVDRSIIMDAAEIDGALRVVDSIVGRGATIASRGKPPPGQSFVIGDASRIVL